MRDRDRATELFLDASDRTVIVYDRTASATDISNWYQRGASSVATTLDEVEECMLRVQEGGSGHEEPVGRSGLIGASPAIRRIEAEISQVANHRCNLLIEGETGTGKEVVARTTHEAGLRSKGPWVAVNCGAIPEPLLEAELFGHVKGAFTGAIQARAGKFEAANHGTIFLDEIGDMPMSTQGRLLRVLQEREVERLGGNERIRLDVRVIAATNVNLAERVRQGLFRQDLFYRLNVFRICIPALRERKEDIEVLARHFLAMNCEREQLRDKHFDTAAMNRLTAHLWPGNVRELENCIETAVILSGSRRAVLATDIRLTSTLEAIPIDKKPSVLGVAEAAPTVALPAEGLDYQQALAEFEKNLLNQALARTRGNKTAAADLLGLKRTTLAAKMRVLEARQHRMVA